MLKKYSFYLLICLIFVSCKQEVKKTGTEEKVNTSVKVVEPGKFKNLLSTTTNPQLVDVRTAIEVAQGVLSGAAHMCYTCPEFEEKIETLDKEEPVFLYCKVGGRSAKAAAILKRKGFTMVYDLKGGIDAWQEAGYELDLFRRPAD